MYTSYGNFRFDSGTITVNRRIVMKGLVISISYFIAHFIFLFFGEIVR